MRHFIWYDTNGELRGVHRRTYGWPDGADPRDPNTSDAAARKVRDSWTGREGFGGFAEYVCVCPSEDYSCSCAFAMLSDHRAVAGVIAPKPELLVELGGESIIYGNVHDNSRINDFAPGSTVQLVLRAGVPDGHSVAVRTGTGAVPLISDQASLVFNDGTSDTLELTVPDQGMLGIVGGQSNLIRRFVVSLRGWA